MPEDASVTWYYRAGNRDDQAAFTAISKSNIGMILAQDLVDGVFTASWTQIRNGEYNVTRWNNWEGFKIYVVISWTAPTGEEQSLTSTRTTWTALLHQPTIATHPADRTVFAGQTANLTVVDTDGGMGASFSWQSSADDGTTWVDLPDATSATLSLTDTTLAQSGTLYRAVVANNAGSVTSDPAKLTVQPSDLPPAIYTSPSDLVATRLTSSVRLSATAEPIATSAQWQVKVPDGEWTDIEGATNLTGVATQVSSSYALYISGSDPGPVDGTQYRVVFSNSAGATATDPATLTMWQAQITLAEETVERGGTVHLSATGLPADQAVSVGWTDRTGTLVEQSQGFTTDSNGALTDLPVKLNLGLYSDNAPPWDGLSPLGETRLRLHIHGVAGVYPAGSALDFDTADTVTVVEDPDAVIPEIIVQPTEKTWATGQSEHPYSVVIADNPGPVYYRWAWKVNLSTPTEANAGLGVKDGNTYTYIAPTCQEGSVYRFWAWTAAGAATSDWVMVHCGAPEAPTVTTQPVNQSVAPGDSVTFTTAGTGVTTPDLQWQKRAPLDDDYVDIPGATATTLTVQNVTEADNGTVFRAVFSNQLGSVRSGAALLSVSSSAQAPQVTAQPLDLTIEAGQTATFTAAASGAPAPSVQWHSSSNGTDWAIVAGATARTLSLTNTTEAMSGTHYKAVFTNSAGSVETDPVVLTVTPPPTERTYVSAADPSVTFTGPTVVEAGADITVSGTGWVTTSGARGSVIAVKLDDGAVRGVTAQVNPETGQSLASDIWAAVAVGPDGSWSATFPYPTPANSNAEWLPGQTHNVRLLTGSLLSGDKIRTESIPFSIAGDTVTGVDQPPVWGHQTVTVTDSLSGGVATAWVENDLAAGDGSTIRIKGHGWVDQAGTGASTIALKLNYGDSRQYTRSGSGIVRHPTATGDDTIWALLAPSDPDDHPNVIVIGPDGNFEIVIDAPAGLTAGQYLTVLFQSGRFDPADVTRAVTTDFLVVGGTPYSDPGAGGDDQPTCLPSTPTPQVSLGASTVALGGRLQVSGTGWCHPAEHRGGSVVTIKLDEGAYSHLTDQVHQNLSVWAIVEADAATGDWSVELQLPDGTAAGADGSSPAFPAGAHSLRLLTGSLKAGDTVRTIESAEFGVGQYAPTGAPDPLEYDEELSEAERGAVTVARAGTALTVTVPGAQAGDWVYLSAYLPDGSPRLLWGGTWFQTDAAGRVTASLAGLTLPVGQLKMVAQSGAQGQTGRLLGWAWLTVDAPPPDDSGSGAAGITTITRPIYQVVKRTTSAATATSTAPAFIPAPPVADASALIDANGGAASGLQTGTVVTVTLPGAQAGDWSYLYVYPGAIPVGWIQVDSNQRVRVDLAGLPGGDYRVVAQDATGALIGWVTASIASAPSATDEPDSATGPAPTEPPDQTTTGLGAGPTSDPEAKPIIQLYAQDLWILAGALVLAAALVVGAWSISRRQRTRRGAA
ncbi:MAG: immunoglobulin domain-containing protein [Propionibacteriaceae bacterium]|nr:immunoglobulin domain-containing protein [Propionibacteriaceae bacterium]